MRELQQVQAQQLRKQEAMAFARTQDMTDVQIMLTARSVRVGTFRVAPTDQLKLNLRGIELEIPCKCLSLRLQNSSYHDCIGSCLDWQTATR